MAVVPNILVLIQSILLILAQNNSENNDSTTTTESTADNQLVTPLPLANDSVMAPTTSLTTQDYPQLFAVYSEHESETNTTFVSDINKSIAYVPNQSLIESKENFDVFNTNLTLKTFETLIKNTIKDISGAAIRPRSKLAVFLAAYLFYPLFETFWFFKGYFSDDKQMMNKYIARYLSIHLKIFSSVVYMIRMPVIVVYFGLVGGHRFLCSQLLSNVPKTLFPQKMTNRNRQIFTAYYMALKSVGFFVGALGSIQLYLRQRIHILETFY